MASDKFPEVGSIAQALKHQIRSGSHWDELTPAAKEALDQVATSIARTVSGDGVHWDAVIGFAQAAKPGTDEVVATVELERGIRDFVREIPKRNSDATP